MSLYILRWNPNISSYKAENFLNLLSHIKNGEQPTDFNWSVYESQDLKKDDIYILQQVGTETDGIAMIGKFKGPCYEGDSWRKDGTKIQYADMWIMDAFDCESENPLPASRYEQLFPQLQWHSGHSGVKVDEKTAAKLLAAIEQDLVKAKIWEPNLLEKFMSWEFEKEEIQDYTDDDDRPSAEALADGRILNHLKTNYQQNPNEDNFIQLILCLRDSVVRLPMYMEFMYPENTSLDHMLESSGGNGIITENIKYITTTVKDSNGEISLPVFSTTTQLGDHYTDDQCTIQVIPFLDCITHLFQTPELNSLVLDPFTAPFVINRELAQFIKELKYKDEE